LPSCDPESFFSFSIWQSQAKRKVRNKKCRQTELTEAWANGHANSNGDGKKHQPLNYWPISPLVRHHASYSYSDVVRLRGSIQIEYTVARLGAERLWNLMHTTLMFPRRRITGNRLLKWCRRG